MRFLLLFLLAVVSTPAAGQPASANAVQYKAVLIAGDRSLPVFDNAVAEVAGRLRQAGTASIAQLSDTAALTARPGVQTATLAHVLNTIASMHPGAGQGCFVFATSHGAQGYGLMLGQDEALSPAELDRALTSGCGKATTVAILSGCFSGDFARPPMARPNRIILTAARADRTSFGCAAGREFTVFDRCVLDAWDQGGSWQHASSTIRACVSAEERAEHVLASQPQAYFGPAVRTVTVPTASAR